jgi:hypothetical protein
VGSGSHNCAGLDAGAILADAYGVPRLRPDGQPEIRTLFFAAAQIEIIVVSCSSPR